MYGKDYNYARSRIEGTIVRIQETNVPVLVRHVDRDSGICSVSKLLDIDIDESFVNLDDLNVEPVPLGFVNYAGDAIYLQRIPNRRGPGNQGLNERNCASSGARLWAFPNKCLHQCIMNEYPSFEKACEESLQKTRRGKYKTIAFHRHWAVSNNNLMYKNRLLVGSIIDGVPTLEAKFGYLKEALEEAI